MEWYAKKIMKKKLNSKFSKLLILFLVIISSVSVIIPPISADDLEDQLDDLEKQIAELDAQKAELQKQIDASNFVISGYSAQASKLYADVLVYKKDKDKLNLQIKELEVNIKILKKQIEDKKADITKTETNIEGLEDESHLRIKNSYMNYRLYDGEAAADNILNVDNINNFFKDESYKEIIQSDTNDLLTELAQLKQELREKKQELNDKLITQNKSKEDLDIKRNEFEKKEADLNVQIAAYEAEITSLQRTQNEAQNGVAVFDEQLARKNAEAEKIRQEIFDNFTPIGAGTFVVAGTRIGNQGCTGLCSGAHLHFMVTINGGYQDPCGYLKAGGPVSGCGWGNSLDWPVRGEVYYTSGFGQRCFIWNGYPYCDIHNAVDLAAVPWNAPVYAAHDGYLHKGVDPYGANYVILCETSNCGGGIQTGYWHLSSM